MIPLALCNDLSAVGRCSIAVQLPVLSALGIEASPLPTAVLSSHTGFSGAEAEGLSDFFQRALSAWDRQGFRFDALLLGYLWDSGEAEALLSYLREHPGTRCFLDPVMADHGRWYQNLGEERIPSMRALLKSSELAFPNLTEACFLGDFDYPSLSKDLWESGSYFDSGRKRAEELLRPLCEVLSPEGKGLIITGIEQEKSILNAVYEEGELTLLYGERVGEGRPGTGDLFSAIAAGSRLSGRSLIESAVLSADFIRRCIKRSEEGGEPPLRGVLFEELLRLGESGIRGDERDGNDDNFKDQ